MGGTMKNAICISFLLMGFHLAGNEARAENMLMNYPLYVPMNSYRFDGYLKDGSHLNFKSRILRDLFNDTEYVRLDDSNFMHHAASSIKHVYDFDSLTAYYYDPYDSCTVTYKLVAVKSTRWVFPKVTGKINLYTSEPREKFTFMKLDNDEIENYDRSKIRQVLKSNEKSREILRRQTIGYETALGLALSGTALCVLGIMNSHNRTISDGMGDSHTEVHFNPLAPVGGAIAISSLIPFFWFKGHFMKSINAFNEEEI
jgi:hypothetical protein